METDIITSVAENEVPLLDTNNTANNIPSSPPYDNTIDQSNNLHNNVPKPTDALKRPHSDTSSVSTAYSTKQNIVKQKKKKNKTRSKSELPFSSEEDISSDNTLPDDNLDKETPLSSKQIFASLEENMLANADKYVLSLNNLRCFTDMVKEYKYAAQIAKDFTTDLHGLINTLQESYPFLSHRATKMKFTKIIEW